MLINKSNKTLRLKEVDFAPGDEITVDLEAIHFVLEVDAATAAYFAGTMAVL